MVRSPVRMRGNEYVALMTNDWLHAAQLRKRLRGQWPQVVNFDFDFDFDFAGRYAPVQRHPSQSWPFRYAQLTRPGKTPGGRLER